MTDVLPDATTLISLGTVGELDLVAQFEGSLVVPPLVRDEVTTEPARTNLSRFVDEHDVRTELSSGVRDRIPQAADVLDETTENGDVQLLAAVLARTDEDRPVGVVSDDRRVRTTARGLGATVTGTVGVVVRAVEEGLAPDDARNVIDRVDSHGLHMTGSLRERAHDLIDEADDDSATQ